MASVRPKILLAFSPRVYEGYVEATALARLEQFADWEYFPCEGGGIYDTNNDPVAADALSEKLVDCDGIVICHGAPTLTDEVLKNAPKLRIIGEMEGDRFASRIDLDAAWSRNVRTVDVTNGSSYPVAEWALGLILVSLRNGGDYFQRILAGKAKEIRYDKGRANVGGRLTGKRVGLIGGGHMARRLIKLLHPFETEIWVHDPYLPPRDGRGFGLCADLTRQCLFAMRCGGLLGATDSGDAGDAGRTRICFAQTGCHLCQCLAWRSGEFASVDPSAESRRYCGGVGCFRP